jgi:uncharacterized Tic20 family protein
MISDEIERLIQLRNSGALSEDEFQQAKSRVLGGQPQPVFTQPTGSAAAPSGLICGLDSRLWCTLMHASQLLTWTGVGIVAPLVMWIIGKNESKEANRHGLVILNWMLSSVVYAVVSVVLSFFVVGIPMLFVLGALHVIFPIIGTLQASSGKLWRYPFSINFFDPDSPV